MKLCTWCGKPIKGLLHPNEWAYKLMEGNSPRAFYCSWKCMRADENEKGDKTMKQVLLKEMEKAAEIAMSGQCPYDYLRKIGVKNVSTSWRSIVGRLQKINKEKYADLPKQFRRSPEKNAEPAEEQIVGTMEIEASPEMKAIIRKAAEDVDTVEFNGKEYEKAVPETAEKEISVNEKWINNPEDAKEIVRKYFSQAETPEEPKMKITKPVNYAGFDVKVIVSKASGATYEYDKRFGLSVKVGHDEIVMPPESWVKLTAEIKMAMAVLGVSV